jgi:penicillin-binding protein 1A
MGRYLGILASGLLMAAALVALVVGFYLFQLTRDLPDFQSLSAYEPPVTTRVHAGDGTLIAEFARERRLFVPYEDIPPNVVRAFIAAEDKNFFNHPGIDVMGVIRAAIDNIYNVMEGRRLEGASTITQQVAKNILLSSEVTMARKLREAMLSFRIERAFTKEQILSLYLNEIYLGNASYGAAAAALNYFDKALPELTLGEAAYLAALPKAPNNYNPVTRMDAAIARRNWVLDRMREDGYITRDKAEKAKAEPITAQTRPFGAQFQAAKYFAEDVRREVYALYGEQSLYDGGLSIRTSIDMSLQPVAIKALRDGLVAFDRRHGWRGPITTLPVDDDWPRALADVPIPGDIAPWRSALVLSLDDASATVGFPDKTVGSIALDDMKWARRYISEKALGPEVTKPADVLKVGDVVYVEPVTGDDGATRLVLRQMPAANGGFIAMDPHTGRVLALVGGFSYDASEFNRATQALRQTGSAFKPFVYAAALDHGYTPASVLLDAPFVMEQGPGQGLWSPENYSQDFVGPSTLRRGIEKSRNTLTVRLASSMGMEPIVENAKKFGVKEDMPPYLSMALGAGETTLMKLTAAYSTFVNGGKRVTPTLIDRIQDRHGRTIFRHDTRACSDCNARYWNNQEEPALPDPRPQILDPTTAYQMVSLLEGVVRWGTGTAVRAVGKPLAGKTGTTNEERDAWFIGFSPDLAAGAYIGFDSPAPLGKGETGGHVAAPVFRDFMKVALADKPAQPFRVPANIRLVRVNHVTGKPTGPDDPQAIIEAFKMGTEPGARSAAPVASDGTSAGSTVSSGTGGLY